MRGVRCPSCRTVNDMDTYVWCAGCKRSLAGMGARGRELPPVMREAQRDGSIGGMFLLTLGVFSVISLFSMVRADDMGEAIATSVLSFGAVGIFLWFAMARLIHGSRRDALSKGVLYIFAFAAAVLGSGLLIYLTVNAFQ